MSVETMGAEECAELMRCTPEHVEEMARAGEIPGLKIGRGWLFLRADLLVFLAEKARAQAQERREKRQPNAPLPLTKPRRQVPPVLPTPRFGASRSSENDSESRT